MVGWGFGSTLPVITGTMMNRDIVKLYSVDCLSCTHLCDKATKTFSCTSDAGNDQCPAQYLQFTVTKRNRLLDAARRGDTAEVERRLTALKNDPEKFAKAIKSLAKLGK